MLMLTPVCAPEPAVRHRGRDGRRGSRPGAKPPSSAARRAARGRPGVSASYPPHLYGLTQFSKGLAVGGRGPSERS